MKLLIKNGLLVNADSSRKADVLCKDGKIYKIAKNIPEEEAEQVIDATGLYVFPGGIDPHVHMHLPSHTGFSSDDFYSGSKAALYGGTTTIIDFVTPHKGQSLTDALAERKSEAKKSLIDFSFHVSPIEWRTTTAQEIKDCIKQGITSFKVYMAYKKAIGVENDVILKVMQVAKEAGALVTAHCEMGDAIELLREKYGNEGKLSPLYHPLSRPAALEAEAVKEFIFMGEKTGCPIYIVHVSAEESLIHIKQAQHKNQKVFAETCPQYLLLDDSKYKGNFNQVAPYVMSPPLRKKEANKALWNALSDGIIQTLGTDHCPFSLRQKQYGITDFRKIPNGAGGVENRLGLIYTYGVLQNIISLNEFVALTSTNAAKIFGLFPKKGIIQEGADADLVIWNPDAESIISAQTQHSKGDTNIFEGMKLKGEVSFVILRGELRINQKELFPGSAASFLGREPQYLK